MDSKATAVLFIVLVACFGFSARCEAMGDGKVPTVDGGGPDAEATTIRSSKLRIVLCVKDSCGDFPKWKDCYCCQTLPDNPCYFDQKECWKVCPSAPSTEPVTGLPSVGYQQQQQVPRKVALGEYAADNLHN